MENSVNDEQEIWVEEEEWKWVEFGVNKITRNLQRESMLLLLLITIAYHDYNTSSSTSPLLFI